MNDLTGHTDYVLILFYRPVTQLAAPKIPEGERVDFDVCYFKSATKGNNYYTAMQKEP